MINLLLDKYKPIFFKYKLIILYVFFGGITTAVNYATYYACKFTLIDFTNISSDLVIGISTTTAWITAVIVAFITNKLFVFESKSLRRDIIIKEFLPFVLARILSFFLDLAIMIVGVNILFINDFAVKTFSNIFVLIFNYIASKLFIFKKARDDS